MPSVRVGTVDVHYVEAGSGQPVLLVMGLGGDHLAWGYQRGAISGPSVRPRRRCARSRSGCSRPRPTTGRPEFVEMVIQTALANPYPQSVTGFVRQAEAVLSHDTLARLAGRGAPTLVSVGEDDALVPPRFSRELAAGFRGARLQLVPRAGHVNYWERADAFNALALEFIEAHRDA